MRAARADAPPTMNSRVETLKQLVADSTYPIDEAMIAEAILVRTLAQRVVPDLALRCAPQELEVRSFRAHRGARSFRLVRSERRSVQRRVSSYA